MYILVLVMQSKAYGTTRRTEPADTRNIQFYIHASFYIGLSWFYMHSCLYLKCIVLNISLYYILYVDFN